MTCASCKAKAPDADGTVVDLGPLGTPSVCPRCAGLVENLKRQGASPAEVARAMRLTDE